MSDKNKLPRQWNKFNDALKELTTDDIELVEDLIKQEKSDTYKERLIQRLYRLKSEKDKKELLGNNDKGE